MQDKIEVLKQHVKEKVADPSFVHTTWFTKWHLEIVEKIANELLEYYPDANSDLVAVLVWLHDYGKILDYDNQYDQSLVEVGYNKLIELGFEAEFARRAADYITLQDQNQTVDLREAPIEVQIVASADGCSHLVGPFVPLYWYENNAKSPEDLMADNRKKLTKDWEGKIVLPEARQAFKKHHDILWQQTGDLPESFLK